jgi:hypothetical protein
VPTGFASAASSSISGGSLARRKGLRRRDNLQFLQSRGASPLSFPVRPTTQRIRGGAIKTGMVDRARNATPGTEVPRDEWPSFFDSFSRLHEGWIGTLEVSRPGARAAVEARDKPLLGITAERVGDDTCAIWIHLGSAADDHVTHVVQRPVRVGVELAPDGADEAVGIEGEGGSTTRLRFRATALPEMLDGAVPGGP